MTPREFFNAWDGWRAHQVEMNEVQYKQQRNLIYSAMRWHASNTAWSKEQSQSISNAKFPWEKEDQSKGQKAPKLTVHDKLGRFIRIQDLKQERKRQRDGGT